MGNLLSFASSSSSLNPLNSQRNVINIWYPGSEWNYRYIDHTILGDGQSTPYGLVFNNAWSATKTFHQVIDQNGYVNDALGSGQTYGGGIRMPKSTDFAGPYVVTWDGDGKVQWVFPQDSPIFTEASTSIVRTGNANGTTTLSGFSDVTGLSIGFAVSGTGVSGGTTIVSINYGAKTIVVSATVTTGTGVSFTFTNNTYTKNANGAWTNTTGGKGYVVFSHASHTGADKILGIQIATTGLGGAISVSSMVWSGGFVTVTTTAPHGRPLGYTLPLTFSGATPASINSTFDCTATGASTYTFALAANPGSITGTLTYIAFVTNLRVYRLEDETDFMPTSKGGNGNIFRTPYKQMMVNLRPAVIRMLNDVDGNSSNLIRFENRSLPTKAGSTRNATSGPAYGPTAGTTYQITVPAVTTGTVGNKQLTPVSMTHGEICQTRLTNAITSTTKTVTAITQANPGNITTSAAHGFSNGDLVWLSMPYPGNTAGSMKELDRVVCKVANATSTTFDIQDQNGVNIDTTSFTAFSSAVGTNSVCRYVSLDVGGRGAYPVVSFNLPQNNDGLNNVSADIYYNYVFDKNQASIRTAGTGANWVQGVWIRRADQAWGDVPLEHCAALVAEVNLLAQSQGITQPIHLWITMPCTGMLDCDPDYTAASEYPINAINALMSGGYGCRGLASTNARLILEWSNEIWNFGTPVSGYTNWLAYVRAAGLAGTANFENIQALRSTRMARSVRAGSSWSSRVFLTLGVQGVLGWGAQNQYVALGNLAGAANTIFTDSWNNWGSAEPVSFHDAINPATYLEPTYTYSNTRYGTGTFTDDSALYSGANNNVSLTATFTAGNRVISGTNSFRAGEWVNFTTTVGNIIAGTNYRVESTNLSGSQFQLSTTGFSPVTPNTNGSASTASGGDYTGVANPSQAITNFVNNLVNSTVNETIGAYCSQSNPTGGILAAYCTPMATRGKRVIQYEGGTNWVCQSGLSWQSHLISANDSTFLNAVNQSSQWATAQSQFFDNIKNLSNHGPAALYLSIKSDPGNLQWGIVAPDSYSGGVEGAAVNNSPMWTTIGARNALLSI